VIYYPYLPVTWVKRFIEGIRTKDSSIILSTVLLKELGISRPGILKKSLKAIDIVSENNTLTELGWKFVNFKTRKEACRVILEKPPYDEILYEMRKGWCNSRTELKEHIAAMTGWSIDPVDKATSLLLYFLRLAEFDELKEREFIQKAQISPKRGTRKGRKNLKKKENINEDE